jgi:hypothetical protein
MTYYKATYIIVEDENGRYAKRVILTPDLQNCLSVFINVDDEEGFRKALVQQDLHVKNIALMYASSIRRLKSLLRVC